jgi:ribosomal RNA-processing protein 9
MKPEEASAETHPDPSIVPQPQPRWITALTTIPYSDLILSGSWDGSVRVWRVSDDKKKIEKVGVVEGHSGHINGNVGIEKSDVQAVKGVINDLAVFERGDRGKDGVCVIVAVGVEHRLGRWQKQVDGKNGSVVFEIPRHKKSQSMVAELEN